MSVPHEPPASFLTTLDVLVRVGGIGIGAAYVAGFLVVATHHAQFGISDFTLLRPKILTAGACMLAVFFFALVLLFVGLLFPMVMVSVAFVMVVVARVTVNGTGGAHANVTSSIIRRPLRVRG